MRICTIKNGYRFFTVCDLPPVMRNTELSQSFLSIVLSLCDDLKLPKSFTLRKSMQCCLCRPAGAPSHILPLDFQNRGLRLTLLDCFFIFQRVLNDSKRTSLSRRRLIWLLPHPLPSVLSVSCLSF
jgi:hypothetical protein